jgi:uncharacterized SAM-binding protein YcdF (DUF218 family)
MATTANPWSSRVDTPIIEHATTLWNYFASFRRREPCDAIVVCCSYDLRVGDYACELLKSGLAPRIVFSGHTGNWTRHLWKQPEAHVFRDRALAAGVAATKILVEDRSTNFGENVRFSLELLGDVRRVIFVTKPNSVLRVLLTVPVQWPGVEASVDSPSLRFPEDASNIVGVLGVIDEMVGDLQRIEQYPALGYQAPHPLPAEIQECRAALVDAGFTRHLMNG